MWAEHQRLLRTAFRDYGGHEVDTQGDSFFVTFARAADAVQAAVIAQRALAAHPWPEGTAVRVRMGLHTGEPTLAGQTYVGLDVHRGARIAAAGDGGQVLLSEATRVLVERELPPGVSPRVLQLVLTGKVGAARTPFPAGHRGPPGRFPAASNA